MFDRLKNLGPGIVVAAAFIGPGTVTTATIAGAGFGYTLLWAILFSIIATIVLQEMSARLGIVSQLGVGQAIRKKIQSPILKWFAFILVIGAIFIGNAAYEAGNITGAVLGFEQYSVTLGSWSFNPLILLIGLVAFILLRTGRYKLIEKFLISLVSIMGVVFFVSAILLRPDINKILSGFFLPQLPENSLMMIVGLIGTTVVPYNLFLHASAVKEKWKSSERLGEARLDTILSVTLGGIITASILITSAVAFEGIQKNIDNAADLGYQLQPVLGDWSTIFIAFGFLAAGLSSSITAPLAAAFATSEILGWTTDMKSIKFQRIWMLVLIIGIFFSSLGFKPTSVILFSQFANGLLLPIIAIFLLWVMNDKDIVGNYINNKWNNLIASLVILITIGLGLKSILAASNIL